MRQSNNESPQLGRRYLDLIGGQPLSLAEKQAFIAETIDAYGKHVNRGFISYRKSVTQAGQYAALEWRLPRIRAPEPPQALVSRGRRGR